MWSATGLKKTNDSGEHECKTTTLGVIVIVIAVDILIVVATAIVIVFVTFVVVGSLIRPNTIKMKLAFRVKLRIYWRRADV